LVTAALAGCAESSGGGRSSMKGCCHVPAVSFGEHASGMAWRRPATKALLEQMQLKLVSSHPVEPRAARVGACYSEAGN